MKKNKEPMSPYFESVHRCGRLWTVGALLVLLSVPVAICLKLNAWPAMNDVFRALVKVLPIYWGTAVVEVLTYTPILGGGATYLSFVTGNITNLKMPVALNALDKAGTRVSDEEGEVVSTISVGVSAITTTVIIAVGVLIFAPFLSRLTDPNAVFAPAFTYILPALFGALGAGYFLRHWKISIFPILIGIVVLLFSPTLAVGTLIFVTIVASLGGAALMLKFKLV